jgi:single-stranded-DNA-specific exonuclease
MFARVWEDVPADAAAVRQTADALRVPGVIARLLCQRGFSDPERAHAFLHPSASQLHDPFLLTGMREATSRILRAVAARERIVIHGDYDVDGITSTVMLRRAIELVGGDVGHFVPDRHKDGYGLQPVTIERLHAAGAGLIVSVDCGIRARDAARRARELGVDLIITDHHEPEDELPDALAVLNPKRHDCQYPEKNLSGAGVALKLVQALMSESGRSADALPHFLKVAAIGTLADVVPLTGENRVIAHTGLSALSRGPNGAGLDALLHECGLSTQTLHSFHVSFIMAPRINAAGRMGSADAALDLLLMRGRDDATRDGARTLAKQLSDDNTRRQEEEAAIVLEARRLVDGDPDIGAHNLLLVSGSSWHRGVIGIVASKLTEAYNKPSLVLSIADGIAHGSGRSIRSFDLLAALESCKDVFLKFGGHRQAAGVTLNEARLPELRRRLTGWANQALAPDDLVPRLRIDAPLGLREIDADVMDGLTRLGPYGAGNPKPVFRAGPIDLVNPPRRMKERHLSLLVRQDGRAFRAVAWRAIDKEAYLLANPKGLELAYSLERGEFRGETTTELTVADVRMLPALPEARA